MIIDISWPISPRMTEYKNRSTIQIQQLSLVEQHGVREAFIGFHNHTGTHIDAPAHFVADGKTTDKYDLKDFMGPCKVFDVTHVQERITVDDLRAYDIQAGDKVLLKTRNSKRAFDEEFDHNFVYISQSAAQFLVDKSIKLIGFDYLGIERNQPGHESHKLFLGNDILILEGIRLGHVTQGHYTLICLPLLIESVDSAPARAILQML